MVIVEIVAANGMALMSYQAVLNFMDALPAREWSYLLVMPVVAGISALAVFELVVDIVRRMRRQPAA
jgi:hypothetical protein